MFASALLYCGCASLARGADIGDADAADDVAEDRGCDAGGPAACTIVGTWRFTSANGDDCLATFAASSSATWNCSRGSAAATYQWLDCRSLEIRVPQQQTDGAVLSGTETVYDAAFDPSCDGLTLAIVSSCVRSNEDAACQTLDGVAGIESRLTRLR